VNNALADPASRVTFERCKLDLTERQRHAGAYTLHRDLLRLRREDAVFAAQGRGGLDGAVLGHEAFVLRWFGDDGDDRLLLVNLGVDLTLTTMPEPLLAPPGGGSCWTLRWSSEEPRYGGGGAVPWPRDGAWTLPGQAAVVLRPERVTA
jgi:maltooligosyltrehalose trehalohydrolase